MKKIKLVYALSGFFLIIILFSCKKEEVIEYHDSVSHYELKKNIIQANTTNLAAGFQSVFSVIESDSAESAQLCQAFIEPIRYFDDDTGYFFLESYDAWMVAHAVKPELIGELRINIQDIYGKYYVQEMVRTIKYSGYGFLEYYFENPATQNIERKIAFVKNIPEVEFFIGSGFYDYSEDTYYDKIDADKQMLVELTGSVAQGIGGVFENIYTDSLERVEFCRQFIDHIRFFDDQCGYFFMYDFDCVNVAHGVQKNLQGQDLTDYQDPVGNYVIQGLLEVVQNDNDGYYEYYWNNPVSSKQEKKLAYVIRIPGTTYYIGSGIYLE
ncbi:cache domain-containing protein [Bacteroidota bacterium]